MTEKLFQHIWSGLYFNTTGLKTTCGNAVSVISQGNQNHADGPDFKNAEIRIGELTFFGDVELHLREQDWFSHSHHTDARYGQVILHVVLSDYPEKRAVLPDGSEIPTLVLQPYISGKLRDVLHYTRERQEMACAGMLHLISPDVIESQITHAHKAYFEYRITELMRFYDPSLPPSKAWQRMFLTGLFEGLGFNHNKPAMAKLCHLLLKALKGNEKPEQIKHMALALSGLQPGTEGAMNKTLWNFSGSRPANQPPARIAQAASLYYHYRQIPLRAWLLEKPSGHWKQLFDNPGAKPGKDRKVILYHTVYLPALHILGSLFHHTSLMHEAFSAWMNSQNPIPASITKAYEKNGFPGGAYKRKLGAVYQYKHLCRKSRCESCFVMQKLLQA